MMYRLTSVLMILLWAQPGWADEGMPIGDVREPGPAQTTDDASDKAVEPPVQAEIPDQNEPSTDPASEVAPGSSSSLSAADQAILDKGLYSNGEIYGTAFVGFAIGFGAGHVIQRRYFEKGWIATVGTLAGFLIMKDATDSTFLVGLAICVGTRVWEIRDLVNSANIHNRRYRALRQQNPVGLLPMTDGERHGLAYTMTF